MTDTDRFDVAKYIWIVGALLAILTVVLALSSTLPAPLGDRQTDKMENASTTLAPTTPQRPIATTTTSSNSTIGLSPTSTPTIHITPTIPPTQTVATTTTPTVTPSTTGSPTAPATSTPTPVYANEKYLNFVSTMAGEAEVDAEVPIRIRGWTVGESNSLVMILNLTAEAESDVKRARQINTLITSGYAQAVAHHDTGKINGKITEGVQILEINNTGAPPKTLYINTSMTRKYYTDQISGVEFTERYWDSERNMTFEEIEFAYKLDKRADNTILHNKTTS